MCVVRDQDGLLAFWCKTDGYGRIRDQCVQIRAHSEQIASSERIRADSEQNPCGFGANPCGFRVNPCRFGAESVRIQSKSVPNPWLQIRTDSCGFAPDSFAFVAMDWRGFAPDPQPNSWTSGFTVVVVPVCTCMCSVPRDLRIRPKFLPNWFVPKLKARCARAHACVCMLTGRLHSRARPNNCSCSCSKRHWLQLTQTHSSS